MAGELKTVTEITLDVTGECIRYLVSAKQGDKSTRYIKARIVQNGEDITVPSGVTARANIRKPDGKTCYNECTWEQGNRAILCLTNQALAAAGTAYCDIELRDTNDVHILSTQSFTIEIERSERSDGAIASSDELTALDKKMQEIVDDAQKKTNAAVDQANAATKKANDAASTAEAAAKKATDTANSAAEQAKSTASSAADTAKKTANEAANNANQKAEAANTAKANAEKATSTATEAATKAENAAAKAETATNKLLNALNSLSFSVGEDGGLDITYETN